LQKIQFGEPLLKSHFFDKNFASLKNHLSIPTDLTNRLTDKIDIVEASSGQPTAKYEGVLLHSKYDPIKEGIDFAKNIKPGSHICLYGFGLGYHLGPLLEKIGPDGYLLVIELNPDLLNTAMMLKDHTELFNNNRFKLIFGVDEFDVSNLISKEMQRLSESSSDQLEILFHAPSFKCLPQIFPALRNALEILLMERRFPAVFRDLEQGNYFLNEEIVKGAPGINSLKNAHRGKPALMVSAGPSLDSVLPYLKYLKRNLVLACVDTVFPALLDNGINPDYVFSLDPQIDSALFFADYKKGQTKLIYTPTANHNVLKIFNGEHFVVFKEGNNLTDRVQSKAKGTTKAGGSVSCLGVDALIQFGCEPIFFTGQDCAFAGNRYYSKHTQFNQKLVSRISGISQIDKLHKDKFHEKKIIEVLGTNDTTIITDQVMYSYLRNLEEIASQCKNTRIYNLCSQGAAIEGVKPLHSVSELRRWFL